MTKLQYAAIKQAQEQMKNILSLTQNSKGKAVKNNAEIGKIAEDFLARFEKCDPAWRPHTAAKTA